MPPQIMLHRGTMTVCDTGNGRDQQRAGTELVYENLIAAFSNPEGNENRLQQIRNASTHVYST
jgi:hypothetical protein